MKIQNVHLKQNVHEGIYGSIYTEQIKKRNNYIPPNFEQTMI